MAAHLTDKKVEADEENPVPYIGMENIESWTGRLLSINPDVVPTGTANAFKAGHTLFGKLRPYLAKACNPDFDGLCSTELLVLNGVEFDRDSLRYALLSDGFIKLVDSSTYGSKMPRASWDFIGNCVLPIPPPAEQRAIAAFLDRETGRVDRLVAKKRELIERLKEKRTVTRGLPPAAARAAARAARAAGLPANPPTRQPANPPTRQPANPPTRQPANPPTRQPANPPTRQPANPPTRQPANPPTRQPANPPTRQPANPPTRPSNPPALNGSATSPSIGRFGSSRAALSSKKDLDSGTGSSRKTASG